MTLVKESQIDGEFKGWEGETKYILIDGSTWKQANYYYYYYYYYRPQVKIFKEGSKYFMIVQGLSNKFEVIPD